MTDSDVWRSPRERSDLVERIVAQEARLRLLEDELRSRVRAEEAFLAGHPTEAALMARVKELEGIVSRLNQRVMGRKRAS